MTLPRRIIREKPTRPNKRIRSDAHLKWVREHECCIKSDNCFGPIQAAHVRIGADGGMGIKPGDNWTISLCGNHHNQQHTMGEPAFEMRHGIDLNALAKEFAAKSPKLRGKRQL